MLSNQTLAHALQLNKTDRMNTEKNLHPGGRRFDPVRAHHRLRGVRSLPLDEAGRTFDGPVGRWPLVEALSDAGRSPPELISAAVVLGAKPVEIFRNGSQEAAQPHDFHLGITR
jgi:hypothetical protein